MNAIDEDAMDALTQYVFFYFAHFQTPHEKAAYKSIVGEEKAKHTVSDEMKSMLHQNWVSTDPAVLRLLESGSEQFFINVRDRILREHSENVFLNYCPRCGALAKTPRAKQCPVCFLSWHEPQK
jgi:rubrerythrin